MDKKMNLLEQAKAIPIKGSIHKPISDEEIELAIAWAKGEISTSQVNKVLCPKSTTGNLLYRISVCFREGYFRGIIKL